MAGYTAEQIAAMRSWVKDCCVDEDEIAEAEDAEDSQIVRIVRRQYDGGIQQFMIDANFYE